MARFTTTKSIRAFWRGNELIGQAGETLRIPDALYDDFVSDFVTGTDVASQSHPFPNLTWITQDEATSTGEHPNLTTHASIGLITTTHLTTADPHTAYALDTDLTSHEGAADPHTGYQKESEKAAASGYASLDAGTKVPIAQIPTGSTSATVPLGDHAHVAAPADADYLVGTAHAGLSAEIVVGAAPGGELGGTWAAPTVDATHSGSTHAATQAAAEATAAGELATHAGAADPHTGYLKESDFDDIDFLVGTATGHTAAEIVVGTSPGGELGGTWAAPTVDATHSGSAHHTQAHTVTGADHTATGLTSGQIMQATGTATFAFSTLAFSRGGTVLTPTGAINVIVWRAPFACTVTAVKGYRVGGTGATINARRNGSLNHLASDLSLTSADTWMDGGAVQNTAYAAGDKLEIMVVTIAGSPTQVAVQVDLTRP